MASMPQTTFKLVIAGDGGVGKSAFIRRHLDGDFKESYIPTLGVDVAQLTFKTNHGELVFWVWDTAGEERYGGLQDGYFLGADCAILMFDVGNEPSYRSVPLWYQKVANAAGKIPTVICGNKVDMDERRVVHPEAIAVHRDLGTSYYDTSAKSNYNFEKPFLELAIRLTGHADLALLH